MATSEFKSAMAQVVSERGVSIEDVMSSIKLALAKAYVKEYKNEGISEEEVVVDIDEDTGESKILDLEGKENYSVLVTVLTDGEENSSKEYTGTVIKNLVDELKQQNWTFTYIGADHDVEGMASKMNIHNTMSFDKNDSDIKRMFARESKSRVKFSLGIRNGETDTNNFYSKLENNKVKKDGFWKKLISWTVNIN